MMRIIALNVYTLAITVSIMKMNVSIVSIKIYLQILEKMLLIAVAKTHITIMVLKKSVRPVNILV